MLHGLSGREVPESLTNVIFDESQGNPFFVEELYRHLVEEGKMFDANGNLRNDLAIDEIDVPENVRLIIGRRLERLSEDERWVLGATAVIGRSFSFQLLAEISHVEIDDLFAVVEKAQQMGIIVPSAEGPESPFTFSHELVRQHCWRACRRRASSGSMSRSPTRSKASSRRRQRSRRGHRGPSAEGRAFRRPATTDPSSITRRQSRPRCRCVSGSQAQFPICLVVPNRR